MNPVSEKLETQGEKAGFSLWIFQSSEEIADSIGRLILLPFLSMPPAMPIILASSSPRRRELLEKAGLVFEVIPSPAEEVHDAAMAPHLLCELNAALKADAVATSHPTATVIGSDTLVFIDGLPLGKPRDMEDARAMLRRLSGRTHQVCTGVCITYPGGTRKVFHDVTDVTFLELDDAAIEAYFLKVNPLDKAGAYGIQEHGESIVSGIRGSFENVMGLPVDKVIQALL